MHVRLFAEYALRTDNPLNAVTVIPVWVVSSR